MNVQKIQSQNPNFNGLVMPKKLNFYRPYAKKNVLSMRDILANKTIKDCAEKYDVVIKKHKTPERRFLTEREISGIFLGGTALGTLAGFGISIMQNIINPGTMLASSFFGAWTGLNAGWLAANLLDDSKYGPKQHEYILQVGKNYNDKNGKFDGEILKSCHIIRAQDVKMINLSNEVKK